MDIKNLLCNNTSTTSEYQQYEKHEFEYCTPTATPHSSISNSTTWSSNSSMISTSSSDSSSVASLSPILSPAKIKHQTRTPWTSSEDYLLEKGYLQGLSWAMISSKYLPHRSRGCCWGRFKTLQTKLSTQSNNSSNERRTWSEAEDRVLVGAIKKHTRLFKQAWRSVALDLNDRDWRECESRSIRLAGGLLITGQKRLS